MGKIWQPFQVDASLSANEVHIVLADVSHFMAQLGDYQQLLNAEELRRYQNTTSLLARALLRKLLGGYLGCSPQAVKFSYGAKGKPQVDGLLFNMSHAQQKIIYIFNRNKRVGIDIEHTQREAKYLNIAKRFFSQQEYQFLKSQTADRLPKTFFDIWTQKEAYVKACGEGVSSFQTFSVLSQPDGWLFERLTLPNNYQGVYVVESTPTLAVRLYHL